MDIFESLENLNVSEECYIDILNMVESIISETKKESKEKRDKWMADQMSKEPVLVNAQVVGLKELLSNF